MPDSARIGEFEYRYNAALKRFEYRFVVNAQGGWTQSATTPEKARVLASLLPRDAVTADESNEIVQRARREIYRICAGRGGRTQLGARGRDWTMCIPVHHDDSDEIFARLADECERLRSLVAAADESRDAWRDYAEHVEGCRACGEMSWTSCSDGTALRLAADADSTRMAMGETT